MSKPDSIYQPVPTEWQPEWNKFATSEWYAVTVAITLNSKHWATLHKRLVNSAFGTCHYACAAYLWNRINPTAKQIKKVLKD